jgi:hypothetical protein
MTTIFKDQIDKISVEMIQETVKETDDLMEIISNIDLLDIINYSEDRHHDQLLNIHNQFKKLVKTCMLTKKIIDIIGEEGFKLLMEQVCIVHFLEHKDSTKYDDFQELIVFLNSSNLDRMFDITYKNPDFLDIINNELKDLFKV